MEEQSKVKGNSVEKPLIKTILVVDDDEGYLFLVKRVLLKSGFNQKIITAHHGLEALQTLQVMIDSGDKLPEIIFLDIKMPIMDGFEFLAKVTQLPALNLSLTRIYICSSSRHPKDKEQASLYPIAGFLTKPLTPAVLQDILF